MSRTFISAVYTTGSPLWCPTENKKFLIFSLSAGICIGSTALYIGFPYVSTMWLRSIRTFRCWERLSDAIIYILKCFQSDGEVQSESSDPWVKTFLDRGVVEQCVGSAIYHPQVILVDFRLKSTQKHHFVRIVWLSTVSRTVVI